MTLSARAWLAATTGIAADDLAITPLRGANSSAVLAVDNARKADAPRFVLRIFTHAQWLADEPDLAIHEAAALREAALCGANSPTLIAFEAADVGFGGPIVLMSRVSGNVELRPADLRDWTEQLAQTLAQIHAHAAPDFGWNYRNWLDPAQLQVPAWATQPQLWQRAIELWSAGPPPEEAVFLHRDFHPCNVLWQDGNVSGVVDWVNACRGPRGVDVAHCRVNLAMLFGVEIADAFRDFYLQRAGGAHHPYWDVDALFNVALPEPEFYAPWAEFGVGNFSAREMMQRNEIYLESIIERASSYFNQA